MTVVVNSVQGRRRLGVWWQRWMALAAGLLVGAPLVPAEAETAPNLTRFARKAAVRFPDDDHGGTRSSCGSHHIDVMPTVLAQLGLPIPEVVQGISLLATGSEEALRSLGYVE